MCSGISRDRAEGKVTPVLVWVGTAGIHVHEQLSEGRNFHLGNLLNIEKKQSQI